MKFVISEISEKAFLLMEIAGSSMILLYGPLCLLFNISTTVLCFAYVVMTGLAVNCTLNAGIKTVLCGCSSCWLGWQKYRMTERTLCFHFPVLVVHALLKMSFPQRIGKQGSTAFIVSWHPPPSLLCHFRLCFTVLLCFAGFGVCFLVFLLTPVPSFLEAILLNSLSKSHVEILFLSSILYVSAGSTAGLQQALPGCFWTGCVAEPRCKCAYLVLLC